METEISNFSLPGAWGGCLPPDPPGVASPPPGVIYFLAPKAREMKSIFCYFLLKKRSGHYGVKISDFTPLLHIWSVSTQISIIQRKFSKKCIFGDLPGKNVK